MKLRAACFLLILIAAGVAIAMWVNGPGEPKPTDRQPPPRAPHEPVVIDGLDEAKRLEIYDDLYRVGLLAHYEADSRYPSEGLSTDEEENEAYLKSRDELYERLKKEAREEIARKNGVGEDILERIEAEGLSKSWPYSDPENPFIRPDE